MKKLILLLGCLVFAYAEVIIEREYDESKYQQEVCGEDYHCFASEYFIPNVDILDAFKQDLQKEIKFPKYDTRELIYRQVIAMRLPNDNNTKRLITFADQLDKDKKTLRVRHAMVNA